MHTKLTLITFLMLALLPIDTFAHEGAPHFHLIDLLIFGLIILGLFLIFFITKKQLIFFKGWK